MNKAQKAARHYISNLPLTNEEKLEVGDYFSSVIDELAELKASQNKVKDDAIRSIKDASWDSRIDGEEYFSASAIDDYADEVEAGE